MVEVTEHAVFTGAQHYDSVCIRVSGVGVGFTSYPKTFLRIGSYYKTTIDNLKIMNHLKLLTKYN